MCPANLHIMMYQGTYIKRYSSAPTYMKGATVKLGVILTYQTSINTGNQRRKKPVSEKE